MLRYSLVLAVFFLTILMVADAALGCTDCDGDGHAWPADCNDADSASYPGATEACDGFDNNCDGLLDNDPPCDNTCDTPAELGDDQRLTSETDFSYSPSTAWTGSGYGIAWADRRFGIVDQIWFMRRNVTGLEQIPAMPITFTESYSITPSLVWTGSEYGLAWARDGQIYFVRLDSAGSKIGQDLPVNTPGGSAQFPHLVWTGAEYGIAWQDGRDGNDEIYFARLDETGVRIGSAVRITSDSGLSLAPRLVSAGGEFGLTWSDDRDGNDEIYFARLDAMGSKLTSDLRITNDAAVSETPDLVWTGSEYGITWRDRRDGNGEIYFALLTAAGVQIGSDARVTVFTGNSSLPRLQWTGGQYGVTWRDRRDGNTEIYFTHLDNMGLRIGSDLRVTNAAGESTSPDLSWTGSAFGLTWTDSRDGNQEIYFSRVSCACGTDDDGDGFTICQGDCDDSNGTVYPGAPPLACDGFNNDCDDPFWPTLPPDEIDADDDSYSICAGDCFDTNGQVYPGAPQICDGLNNDCDHPSWPATIGTTDGDNDGDGFSACEGDCDDTSDCTHPGAAPADSVSVCMRDCDFDNYGDLTPSGTTVPGSDCADDNPTVYPGAVELCDNLNNNCSDPAWPDPTNTEIDSDGDSLAPCQGDCDDSQAAVYPGAPQICDGFNNNCSHPDWPALTNTDEGDDDGDGLSECAGDCDDTRPDIRPGVEETCDFLDNDCNGLVDDGPFDMDGDGVSTCAGDCDESDATVYPAAPQICDGLNNDCNHPSWPALTGTEEVEDWDGDGYTGCQNDCDVLNSEVYPGAVEVCDGWDNNCDDVIDDLPGCSNGCDFPESVLPEVLITDQPGRYKYPSMVSAGGSFAMAWADNRHGNFEIFFVFLDQAGQKVSFDHRVTSAAYHSWYPDLVWTGQEFGLAWVDSRDTVSSANGEIYFNRLNAAGQKAGLDVRVTTGNDSARVPDLVWTGADYGLVWQDSRSSFSNIYFTRLSSSGEKLAPEIPLSSGGAHAIDPSITWTGTHYAVVWRDYRHSSIEIYLALIDTQGNQIQELRITNTSAGSWDPEIAWTGNELGLFWTDGRDGNDELYFVQLDGFGARLSADLPLTQYPQTSREHQVVWTGEEFGVARIEDGDVRFLRVDPSGLVLGPEIPVTNLVGQSPGPAWNGSIYGIFGHDGQGNWNSEILFTQVRCDCEDVDGDGDSSCIDCDDSQPAVYHGAPQVCDEVNNDCSDPSWPGVANTHEGDDDGDGLSECQGDCDDTLATIRPGLTETCDLLDNDCNGLVDDGPFDLDADGVSFCAGDCDESDPTIYPDAPQICDGLNNDCNHPSWPALTGTEEVEDWDGDGVTGCQNDCDVLNGGINPDADEVCDGLDNNCDGAIDDLPGCENDCDLAGHVFPEVLITDQPGRYKFPSMVNAGAGFALAWSDQRGQNFEIYSAIVDEAGQKIAGDHKITTAQGHSWYPDLAWAGTEFGLAWADARDGAGINEIYFARLDATGQKIGLDLRVTMAESDARYPDLVWTGFEYGLAWQDTRGPFTSIYFSRLSAAGVKLGSEIPLSIFPDHAIRPSIAWTGTNYAVAWSDYRHESTEIYLALVDAQGNLAREVRITDDGANSEDPQVVWTGSEIVLFWTDDRDGGEQLYFARLDAFGTRLAADIRLTRSPLTSTDHHAVWTGGEFGVARIDQGQVHFLRVDPSGLLLAPDFPVTNLTGQSPGAAWNGNLYGLFGHDEMASWNSEILFTQILCGCGDVDGDGELSCVDCDDNDPDVYWGAPQACDGVNNDCGHPSWPALTGTNEGDDDMDGFTICAGDCDNAQTSVYPGATEVCDGFNNDCNAPGWPSLATVGETSSCLIDLTLDINGDMTWGSITPYAPWNIYRGDLSILGQILPWQPTAGNWTQEPESNALAAQNCSVSLAEYTDAPDLAPGEIAFYLATGLTGSVESSLGRWWHESQAVDGQRSNDNSCP